MTQLEYFADSKNILRHQRGIKLWGLLLVLDGIVQICGFAVPIHLLVRFGYVASSIMFRIAGRYQLSPISGVLLICLGVGVCNGRRWAHSLTIAASIAGIYSGLQYLTGSLGTASFFGPLGSSLRVSINPPFLYSVIFCTLIAPALLLWYFSQPSVAGDFARTDPHSRWTDRCPIPVLILCIVLALSAFDLLLRPFRNQSPFSMPDSTVIKLYATHVALLLIATHAALLLITVALCLRLKRLGWLSALAISIVDCGFSVRSFTHNGAWQIIKPVPGQPAPVTATVLIWTCLTFRLLLDIAMFAFTLCTRRFFQARPVSTTEIETIQP